MHSPSRIRLVYLSLIAVAITFAPQVHAGAWTRPSAGWFVSLGYGRWFTDRRFDEGGNEVDFMALQPGFDDTDEYRSQALRIYGEYGLTDDWTVIGDGVRTLGIGGQRGTAP